MPSLKKVKARYGEVMPNKVKLYLKEGVNKAQNIFQQMNISGLNNIIIQLNTDTLI